MIETDWPPLMPDVARRLLGDPQKKTAREWRYGRKGSLVVHIEGEHPGTWHDFERYCQVKWNSRVLEAKPVVGRT